MCATVHRMMRLRYLKALAFLGLVSPIAAKAQETSVGEGATTPSPLRAPDVSSIRVGDLLMVIPVPEGYVRIDGIDRQFDRLEESSISWVNRLLANYGTPETRASIEEGKIPYQPTGFNLQIERKMEGQSFTLEQFAEIKEMIKGGLENLTEKYEPAVGKSEVAVSDFLQNKAKIEFDTAVPMGVFEDEEHSLGFSIFSKVKLVQEEGVGEELDVTRISACCVTLVRGKPLYLYANSEIDSEAERSWAEKAVRAWRDEIHLINGGPIPASSQPVAVNGKNSSAPGGLDRLEMIILAAGVLVLGGVGVLFFRARN